MANKLTPIFPPSVKPARVGVYLTHTPTPGRYAYWNGEHWTPQRRTVFEADRYGRRYATPAARQRKPWQGLAKDPRHV